MPKHTKYIVTSPLMVWDTSRSTFIDLKVNVPVFYRGQSNPKIPDSYYFWCDNYRFEMVEYEIAKFLSPIVPNYNEIWCNLNVG